MSQAHPPSQKRAAAAVVLIADAARDPRVYLVERAPELRFFGGYWALPGGTRGPEDGADDPKTGDRAPLLRCAARELEEETGIALPPERLREVCRIETPPFAPVRYDTLFAMAEVPSGQEPKVTPGELVNGAFWRPADALRAWRAGELLIVPPVLILLEAMLAHGCGDAFVAAMAGIAQGYRDGKLHRVRFAPGVLMASVLSPTLPPATTTNCYVVGEQRLYVIDPGTHDARETERLCALLDELRGEGRTLEAILLTHHHVDHVGAVTPLSRRYGLPVHAHAMTLGRLKPGFTVGKVLTDGDRLPLGRTPDGRDGWELEAVFTPGHDRGHLCFRDSRYASVIAGDMLSTVSTIVIDPPEGHMRTYLESLERLLAEPMGTLHPAHGPAARDGHRLVRQYLRHRSQRESALVQALAEGPTTIEALVPKIYWEIDASMHPIAARSLLAGVEKLAEDGRARQLPDGRWVSSGSNTASTGR